MNLHYENGTDIEIIDDFEYEVEDDEVAENVLKPIVEKWAEKELKEAIEKRINKLNHEELIDLYISYLGGLQSKTFNGDFEELCKDYESEIKEYYEKEAWESRE